MSENLQSKYELVKVLKLDHKWMKAIRNTSVIKHSFASTQIPSVNSSYLSNPKQVSMMKEEHDLPQVILNPELVNETKYEDKTNVTKYEDRTNVTKSVALIDIRPREVKKIKHVRSVSLPRLPKAPKVEPRDRDDSELIENDFFTREQKAFGNKLTEKKLSLLKKLLNEIRHIYELYLGDLVENQMEIFDCLHSCFSMTKYEENMQFVTLRTLEILILICMEFSQLRKAEEYIKEYKKNAVKIKDFKKKLKAFEWLIDLTLKQRDYHKALNYTKKLIALTWVLKDDNKEIEAYDQLGKIYFYLQETQKARYYHNKMLEGGVEPNDSPEYIKAQAMHRNKYLSKHNKSFQDSEDEVEVDIPYKEAVHEEENEESPKTKPTVINKRKGYRFSVLPPLKSDSYRLVSKVFFPFKKSKPTSEFKRIAENLDDMLKLVKNDSTAADNANIREPAQLSHLSSYRKLNYEGEIDLPNLNPNFDLRSKESTKICKRFDTFLQFLENLVRICAKKLDKRDAPSNSLAPASLIQFINNQNLNLL